MAPLGCQLTCPHWTRGLRLKHGNTEDLEAPRRNNWRKGHVSLNFAEPKSRRLFPCALPCKSIRKKRLELRKKPLQILYHLLRHVALTLAPVYLIQRQAFNDEQEPFDGSQRAMGLRCIRLKKHIPHLQD